MPPAGRGSNGSRYMGSAVCLEECGAAVEGCAGCQHIIAQQDAHTVKGNIVRMEGRNIPGTFGGRKLMLGDFAAAFAESCVPCIVCWGVLLSAVVTLAIFSVCESLSAAELLTVVPVVTSLPELCSDSIIAVPVIAATSTKAVQASLMRYLMRIGLLFPFVSFICIMCERP